MTHCRPKWNGDSAICSCRRLTFGPSRWRWIRTDRSSRRLRSYPQDAYNQHENKSYSFFDQPHVLNILWSWNMPFGKGKRWLGTGGQWQDWIVGGWTLSGIQQYRSSSLIQVVRTEHPWKWCHLLALQEGECRIRSDSDRRRCHFARPQQSRCPVVQRRRVYDTGSISSSEIRQCSMATIGSHTFGMNSSLS